MGHCNWHLFIYMYFVFTFQICGNPLPIKGEVYLYDVSRQTCNSACLADVLHYGCANPVWTGLYFLFVRMVSWLDRAHQAFRLRIKDGYISPGTLSYS